MRDKAGDANQIAVVLPVPQISEPDRSRCWKWDRRQQADGLGVDNGEVASRRSDTGQLDVLTGRRQIRQLSRVTVDPPGRVLNEEKSQGTVRERHDGIQPYWRPLIGF